MASSKLNSLCRQAGPTILVWFLASAPRGRWRLRPLSQPSGRHLWTPCRLTSFRPLPDPHWTAASKLGWSCVGRGKGHRFLCPPKQFVALAPALKQGATALAPCISGPPSGISCARKPVGEEVRWTVRDVCRAIRRGLGPASLKDIFDVEKLAPLVGYTRERCEWALGQSWSQCPRPTGPTRACARSERSLYARITRQTGTCSASADSGTADTRLISFSPHLEAARWPRSRPSASSSVCTRRDEMGREVCRFQGRDESEWDAILGVHGVGHTPDPAPRSLESRCCPTMRAVAARASRGRPGPGPRPAQPPPPRELELLTRSLMAARSSGGSWQRFKHFRKCLLLRRKVAHEIAVPEEPNDILCWRRQRLLGPGLRMCRRCFPDQTADSSSSSSSSSSSASNSS